MANNVPNLVNQDIINLYESAGFDPRKVYGKTVDIVKSNRDGCEFDPKTEIKKFLRIKDEQVALNRYKWYNLPNGLDGQLLERILYYKGQAMFFYSELDDTFYFLPYALNGTIDLYGRFTRVSALPFNGSTESKDKVIPIEAFTRDVIYDISEDSTQDQQLYGCVLLSDYSKQISQTNISRQLLQDPIIDMEAEALPFAATSLIANSGVRGMRVPDQDSYSNVESASRAMTRAALTRKPLVPIVGQVDFQDLTNGSALRSEEYLLYMQAIDNLRLSAYGIGEGALFEKKSHMLQSEQQMNAGNEALVYQDGLSLRQKFCDIVNSIWGLGIWCEPSEHVTGIDSNIDGEIMDNQDQSGMMQGEQPIETGVSEDE